MSSINIFLNWVLIFGNLGAPELGVFGAGLDVTEPEPLPPESPLWTMDNVIITPHIAWYGNNRERQLALARENIRRFIAGDPLLNVVDPAKGY